jgi:hypothetical protein
MKVRKKNPQLDNPVKILRNGVADVLVEHAMKEIRPVNAQILLSAC